jgi:hypothetical protein
MDDFWTIIDSLGWGTKTTDHKALRNCLLVTWTPDETTWFRSTLGAATSVLRKRIRRWESETGEELALVEGQRSDLLYHIVGLGRAEYHKTMHDPSVLIERVQQRDFTESFSYAIPWLRDYPQTEERNMSIQMTIRQTAPPEGNEPAEYGVFANDERIALISRAHHEWSVYPIRGNLDYPIYSSHDRGEVEEWALSNYARIDEENGQY